MMLSVTTAAAMSPGAVPRFGGCRRTSRNALLVRPIRAAPSATDTDVAARRQIRHREMAKPETAIITIPASSVRPEAGR